VHHSSKKQEQTNESTNRRCDLTRSVCQLQQHDQPAGRPLPSILRSDGATIAACTGRVEGAAAQGVYAAVQQSTPPYPPDHTSACVCPAACTCSIQERNRHAEARVWLFTSLSQLQHLSPSARCACFHPCFTELTDANSSSRRGDPRITVHPPTQPSPVAACHEAELQLLQLLAESAPADVSTLLLRDPQWLCSFLTASQERIRAWFGHFGPTGIQHFKFGARALANYALAQRSQVWQHLVWAGKHSQSPVAVAAKPHYFG
jgi:hypothetical protein